jgi:transporter family-2 protein
MIYFVLALLAGVCVSVQLGVNAQLRQEVTNPVISALISFSVGTIALCIYVLGTSRQALPSLELVRSIAWWKWTGGILGVIYITTAIVVGPRIGAANFISLVVAGQLLAAVLFDHFGYVGFPVHPATVYRLLGVLLIVAGVYLIQKN